MRGTIGESRIAPADCLARKDVRVLLSASGNREKKASWGVGGDSSHINSVSVPFGLSYRRASELGASAISLAAAL